MPPETERPKKRIAILGAGPSGLFMYKRLIETGRTDFEIDIFERKAQVGAGMPYSTDGANDEHITNVSDNEIPEIVTTIHEWVWTAPKDMLERFGIEPEKFNEYKVLPRLFFGEYLSAQFDLLQAKAIELGITTHLHLQCNVTDIIDQPNDDKVLVEIQHTEKTAFDSVIICTGHHWPTKHEGIVPGYYDSPYPPAKLQLKINHPIAIKGSSLTAIDAIRTLARHNGMFEKDHHGNIKYHLADDSAGFKIIMHSKHGMLPAIRFHLEDTHLRNKSMLTAEEIDVHMADNNGYLSLDYLFEKDFKELLREKDAVFYERIQHMDIETFVETMMELRERLDPFTLFKAEYAEAEKSIRRHTSVYWKEVLAMLSFAMNYPAKHLSAEDMIRLHRVLQPLISIVIAFVPQSSARELMALHDAGLLELVAVGNDSCVQPETQGGITYHYKDHEDHQPHADYYKTFVDCVGQPHLCYEEFPFQGLLKSKSISPARLKFRSAEAATDAQANGQAVEQDDTGDNYLKVAGITINDNFQVIDQQGSANPRIFIMAVPYISGYNPDYSGLDFCEEASGHIVKCIAAV